jgi:hypothetical protein
LLPKFGIDQSKRQQDQVSTYFQQRLAKPGGKSVPQNEDEWPAECDKQEREKDEKRSIKDSEENK